MSSAPYTSPVLASPELYCLLTHIMYSIQSSKWIRVIGFEYFLTSGVPRLQEREGFKDG